jgi:hypothetical protein
MWSGRRSLPYIPKHKKGGQLELNGVRVGWIMPDIASKNESVGNIKGCFRSNPNFIQPLKDRIVRVTDGLWEVIAIARVTGNPELNPPRSLNIAGQKDPKDRLFRAQVGD